MSDSFNSLSGYSVNIPPIEVIDENGNFICNVNTTGIVVANGFYSDGYFFANGEPYVPPAAGNTTEIQFNNNGIFSASNTFTFNNVSNTVFLSNLQVNTFANLGNVSNVRILGGNNNNVLRTDGTGNLSWFSLAGTLPGAPNTSVQFNDGGVFGGDPVFNYNKNTDTLSVPNLSVGNITGNFIGNISNAANANYANYAGNVVLSNQPNITNVGPLISLTVSNNNGFVNFANTSSVTLGNISNLHISGGANGYFLTTDGNSNLSWVEDPGQYAAGTNTQVQYNDNGILGGNPGMTFEEGITRLTANNFVATSTANLGYASNVTILGGVANYVLTTNGMGNLFWGPGGNGGGNGNATFPGGSNGAVQFNDNGTFGGLGTLSFNKDTSVLTVGNGIIANTFTGNGAFLTNINASNIVGNIPFANLATYVTNNAQPNITSLGNLLTLKVDGIANFANSSQVYLPVLEDLSIPGGSNGYFLMTNGNSGLSWQPVSNGAGTPGGNTGDIQFNNNGSFGGTNAMSFNSSNSTLTIGGNLVANTFQIGSGVYKFLVSKVYFATTTSTTINQVLWSIPVSEVASVDFTIISTDAVNGTRTSTKISATQYAGQVAYNEYAGLQINGGVGVFSVIFYPGDLYTPASMRLLVSPDSAALTQYKILINEYTI
jgi:hypothetical protein